MGWCSIEKTGSENSQNFANTILYFFIAFSKMTMIKNYYCFPLTITKVINSTEM